MLIYIKWLFHYFSIPYRLFFLILTVLSLFMPTNWSMGMFLLSIGFCSFLGVSFFKFKGEVVVSSLWGHVLLKEIAVYKEKYEGTDAGNAFLQRIDLLFPNSLNLKRVWSYRKHRMFRAVDGFLSERDVEQKQMESSIYARLDEIESLHWQYYQFVSKTIALGIFLTYMKANYFSY